MSCVIQEKYGYYAYEKNNDFRIEKLYISGDTMQKLNRKITDWLATKDVFNCKDPVKDMD